MEQTRAIHGVVSVGSDVHYVVIHAGTLTRYQPGKPQATVPYVENGVVSWVDGWRSSDVDEAQQAAASWLASSDAPEPAPPVKPRARRVEHKALRTKW